MKRPSLAEIVKALHAAGIPPKLSADQSRLLIRGWQLVAKGKPVSREQVKETASQLQMPLDAAHSFLKQESEIDTEGNLVGIAGLSQRKHPHRFQIGDDILFSERRKAPFQGHLDSGIANSYPLSIISARLTSSTWVHIRGEPAECGNSSGQSPVIFV
jgi:hypothetical protein